MEQASAEKSDPRYRLKRVEAVPAARRLLVAWADGHVSRFPFVWLRHALFSPALGRPEQDPNGPALLPEEPETARIGKIESNRGSISIFWQHDSATTSHDLAWLRDNCPSDEARRERRPKPALWTKAEAQSFPWFDPRDVVSPGTRLALFRQLRDSGIALLRDVPTEPGTVAEVAAHFGALRSTHHGSLFDIRSLPLDRRGPRENIGATATNAQAPHTDEAFFHSPPGIMFFHCLKPNPGGGASLFVDGIAAAEALRHEDPDAFAFLSTTPLLWLAERNPEERFRSRARLIATDSDGIVRGIRMADRTLPPLDLPEDKIEEGYRALRALSRLLYAPGRAFERALQAGELVIFDNHRVLHARRAFDPESGLRHIQQCSVEREEFHNRFRQLAEGLGRHDLALWEQDAGALSQA